MEHVKCFICGSDNTQFLLHPRRGRSIYRCLVCTNAFTVPTPKVAYDADTFFLGAQHDEQLFRSYAAPIVSFFSHYVHRGKVLDVGAGGGFLIEESIRRGFTAEGIEPSRKAVTYCLRRKLRVKQGYFRDGIYKAGSFDVVVMSHVLEHVDEPGKFLRAAKSVLRSGGIVCLSQTNYTGTIPRLYQRYWEGWVPNQHCVHFSPAGISHLLSANGFTVTSIKILPLGYIPLWRWGGVSTIANNMYNCASWLISVFRIGFPFVGDQMYVVAHPTQ